MQLKRMLERKNFKLDLYSILRLSKEDLTLEYEEFKKKFKKLKDVILFLNEQGKIDINEKFKSTADESIIYGLNNVGMYHAKRPLIKSKDNFHKSSRDFFIQENDSLLTIFGGKWTTSPTIARKIVTMI